MVLLPTLLTEFTRLRLKLQRAPPFHPDVASSIELRFGPGDAVTTSLSP